MALRPVDLCTDCFFLLDCARVFNTAMVKGNEIYFDRADIARLYLRSWFCVDFFSSVPYGTLLKVGRSRERGSGRGRGACGRCTVAMGSDVPRREGMSPSSDVAHQKEGVSP